MPFRWPLQYDCDKDCACAATGDSVCELTLALPPPARKENADKKTLTTGLGRFASLKRLCVHPIGIERCTLGDIRVWPASLRAVSLSLVSLSGKAFATLLVGAEFLHMQSVDFRNFSHAECIAQLSSGGTPRIVALDFGAFTTEPLLSDMVRSSTRTRHGIL